MPSLRLYRAALIVAVILAAVSLLTLRQPPVVPLAEQPTVYDARAAMTDLQTIVRTFPGRHPGSPADRRAAGWVAAQFRAAGLEPQVEPFPATIDGRPVSLNNVWAVSPGKTTGAIVVLAPRDSPPLATQGADDDASGTASLVELARVFAGAGHAHPMVFLSTDGDGYGSLGATAFLDRHSDQPIVAVVALRAVAGRDARGLSLNGWSSEPLLAPPWLWTLARSVSLEQTALRTPLPPITSQVLRLGVPAAGGSQAPFVAAGLPAIGLSASGPSRPATADTLAAVSAGVLDQTGRTAEQLVTSLDGAPLELPPSGSTVFFSKYRQLSGGALTWILIVLMVPLALVTVDLLARAVRRRLALRHAVVRLVLRAAPWIAALLLVYAAGLLSQLPAGEGGVIPPDAVVSHTPRYLRVVLVLLFLAVAYHYAMRLERRLAHRYPADTEAVVAVTHTALLAMGLLMALVNTFSLVLILPAALLWPLARPGAWTRSRLPVWAGLVGVAFALLYFGTRLQLGFDVWWYFFLLIESRAIPVAAVVLAVLFVASAALLGHELNAPLVPAAVRRRAGVDVGEPSGGSPDGVDGSSVDASSGGQAGGETEAHDRRAQERDRRRAQRHAERLRRLGRLPEPDEAAAGGGADAGHPGDERETGGRPKGRPPVRSVRRWGPSSRDRSSQ